MAQCEECPYANSKYVYGSGDLDSAQVVALGGCPGVYESERQKAFVGTTGVLIRDIFEALGISKAVYYTNVMKRRPLNLIGQQKKPSRADCGKCGFHLADEFAKVKPLVVVSFGSVPLHYLTGHPLSLSTVHGLPLELQKFGHAFTLIPTYDVRYVMHKGGVHSLVGDAWIDDLEDVVYMYWKKVDIGKSFKVSARS